MTRSQLEPYLDRCLLVSTVPVGKKRHDYFLHHQIKITVLEKTERETIRLFENFHYDSLTYEQFTIDHLWISPTVVNAGNVMGEFLKLFDKIFPKNQLHFIAKVEKYKRNDGTIDYGLTFVTTLEKFVYQILISEYYIHANVCGTEAFGKFYNLYKRNLTNSPIEIQDLFVKYRTHAKKISKELKNYKEYRDEILNTKVTNTLFKTEFAQDRYLAFLVVHNVCEKVNEICKFLNVVEKKIGKKLLKKENKRKFRQKVKSRARGFVAKV
jgi:hypothetical protein